MGKRWRELVVIVDKWPARRREDAEQILAVLVDQGGGAYKLSDDEREAIERSRVQARRGEFASDEEIAAILRKHGL